MSERLLASLRWRENDPLTWGIICLSLLALPFVLKVVLLWIIVPLRQWRKPTFSVDPDLEPTEADQLTPEMTEFLAPLLPKFKAEGFEVVANVRHNSTSLKSTSFQLLLVNRRTSISAIIILTQSDLWRNCVYAFKSRFADDFEIHTGMNRDTSCFPANPQVNSVAVPGVQDVSSLLELHRRRVRKLGREHERGILPAPGEELAMMVKEWRRQIAWYVRCRYCYLDPAAKVYRRTLKGAFLTIWRIVPPIGRWRTRLRDRRSLRLWRELKMGEWIAAHPQAQTIDAKNVSSVPAISAPLDPLKYELALDEGEIRQELAPDGLVIRMGKQSTRAYLGANWLNLVFIAVYLLLIVQFSLMALLLRGTAIPGRQTFAGRVLPWLLLIGFFLVLQTFMLLNGLGRSGGTAVVLASAAGLRFSNVPARRREGHIARENLRGLHVVVVIGNGFRKSYRLVAGHRAGRQILLAGRDRQALLEVRSSLARALGIIADAGGANRGDNDPKASEMFVETKRILP
jgi:hypothetical protein